jgi:hypothetical protein
MPRNITAKIPEDLHAELKAIAAFEDETLQTILLTLVMEFVNEYKKEENACKFREE